MKKFYLFAAIVAAAIIGFTNNSKDEVLSDMMLENIEALASGETSEEFTEATCCKAVWENINCSGCNGFTYSYAQRI